MTRVILRRYLRSGEILACFPDAPADMNGHRMMTYEHIGQHGSGGWGWILACTEPAKEDDPKVLEMIAELRLIGYDPLEICQRETEAMRRRRRLGVRG